MPPPPDTAKPPCSLFILFFLSKQRPHYAPYRYLCIFSFLRDSRSLWISSIILIFFSSTVCQSIHDDDDDDEEPALFKGAIIYSLLPSRQLLRRIRPLDLGWKGRVGSSELFFMRKKNSHFLSIIFLLLLPVLYISQIYFTFWYVLRFLKNHLMHQDQSSHLNYTHFIPSTTTREKSW